MGKAYSNISSARCPKLWPRFVALTALIALCLSAAGCGDIGYSISRPVDTTALERDLVVGESTEAEVRQALKAPDGIGRYFSPAEQAPLVMWAYNSEEGTLGVHTKRNLLFVLFRDGTYDGYVWFSDNLVAQ